MSPLQRTLTLAILSVLLPSLPLPASESPWVHEVSDVVNPRVGQFRIKTVAAEDGHLVGSATYREKVSQDAVKIDGTKTRDGRFWPSVVVEVANDLDGEWKKLDVARMSGQPASVILKFYEANIILYLNLDAFRPLIEKMRYGRIVLGNGQDTLFELNELLPTADAQGRTPEPDWDTQTVWGYLEDPLVKGSFVVVGISFRGGRLLASASYFEPQATSPTIIGGTKTPEGDFWAQANLQVANDPGGEWKTIGQAATPGKASALTVQPEEKSNTVFNVDVGLLRPMVGKFGYGRAVLKNGKSAAFELIHLLPPNNRR